MRLETGKIVGWVSGWGLIGLSTLLLTLSLFAYIEEYFANWTLLRKLYQSRPPLQQVRQILGQPDTILTIPVRPNTERVVLFYRLRGDETWLFLHFDRGGNLCRTDVVGVDNYGAVFIGLNACLLVVGMALLTVIGRYQGTEGKALLLFVTADSCTLIYLALQPIVDAFTHAKIGVVLCVLQVLVLSIAGGLLVKLLAINSRRQKPPVIYR